MNTPLSKCKILDETLLLRSSMILANEAIMTKIHGEFWRSSLWRNSKSHSHELYIENDVLTFDPDRYKLYNKVVTGKISISIDRYHEYQ